MILYKYLEPSRLDVLKRKKIRFTQPGDFNDPFEFRPRIRSAASEEETRNYIKENFEELVDKEPDKYGALTDSLPKDMLRQMLIAEKARLPELFKLLEPQMLGNVSVFLDRFISENVGVLCLSEVRDSILMWGHYTENHHGFVVGFDADHSFFSARTSEQDEFGFLRRVNYQQRQPNVVLSDTSSLVWFQTKSEQWSYEKEWRVMRVLSDAECRMDAAPFPICLVEFPPDAVLEIIVAIDAVVDSGLSIDSRRIPKSSFAESAGRCVRLCPNCRENQVEGPCTCRTHSHFSNS